MWWIRVKLGMSAADCAPKPPTSDRCPVGGGAQNTINPLLRLTADHCPPELMVAAMTSINNNSHKNVNNTKFNNNNTGAENNQSNAGQHRQSIAIDIVPTRVTHTIDAILGFRDSEGGAAGQQNSPPEVKHPSVKGQSKHRTVDTSNADVTDEHDVPLGEDHIKTGWYLRNIDLKLFLAIFFVFLVSSFIKYYLDQNRKIIMSTVDQQIICLKIIISTVD